MTSKQTIVDEIIADIEKGMISRGDIVSKYCKKFQKSDRTIDTYWKIAQEQHSNKQQGIKRELAELDKEAAIEARKRAIMTSEERKEFLSKVIKAEIKTIRKKMWLDIETGKWKALPIEEDPSIFDRIRAMSELNKMDGEYAPIKVANTNKDGLDVIQANKIYIVPPGEEFEIKEVE
jgi:hypothetical protein